MRYGLMTCAALMGLGGCILSKPHNDVLIFGTTTKVAIDVSAPVQNGAIPEFTIGYKRNEGVWMPLKQNGSVAGMTEADLNKIIQRLDDCTAGLVAKKVDPATAATTCANFTLPGGKYVSYSAGIDKDQGGATGEVDTYSVFASFGGRGSLGFSNAGGALAQFFATGIAAQRLGANPGLAEALNAGSDEAAAVKAAADAAAKVAKANADAQVAAAAIKASVAPNIEAANNELAALAKEWGDCADPEKENAKFKEVAAEGAKTRPLLAYVGIQDTKVDALEALKTAQSADTAEFRRVLKDKCKGT